MHIDLLHEFSVVAHCLNITTAANELHLSQPVVSKHIASLEKELGVKLFKRSKPIELTKAGQCFFEDVIQINHEYAEAVRRCKEAAALSKEKISIQEPVFNDALGLITYLAFRRFQHEYPHVLTSMIGIKKRAKEALLADVVDIALTVGATGSTRIESECKNVGLVALPIIKEPLYCYAHSSSVLCDKPELHLADILEADINMVSSRHLDSIRYAIIDLFEQAVGRAPSLVATKSDTLDEFFMSSRSKDAVYLVTPMIKKHPLLSADNNMVFLPITDEQATLTSYVVFKEDHSKKNLPLLLDIIVSTARNSGMEDNGAQILV